MRPEGWTGERQAEMLEVAEGPVLWEVASAEPATIADLAARAGLDPVVVAAQVTMLELEGWLERWPGARYARGRRS